MGTISGEIHSDPTVDKNQYAVTFLDRNQEGVTASGVPYFGHAVFRKLDPHSAGESFAAQLCAGDYDVVLSEKQHAGNNVWGSAPTQKIVFDTQHTSQRARVNLRLAQRPRANMRFKSRLQTASIPPTMFFMLHRPGSTEKT